MPSRGLPTTIRIHIIDDDDAVRDSTRALLESYGYDVCEHPSAEAFLDYSGEKAGLLLVDHHMPGLTGLELLEHLRRQGDRTPALVITGRSDPTLAERVARLGVKLLHKPLGEDQLVEWIEQARLACA